MSAENRRPQAGDVVLLNVPLRTIPVGAGAYGLVQGDNGAEFTEQVEVSYALESEWHRDHVRTQGGHPLAHFRVGNLRYVGPRAVTVHDDELGGRKSYRISAHCWAFPAADSD